MLNASNKGTQVPLIEAGLHEAVCYGVIDVGTVTNETFNVEQRKIILLWELPKVRINVPEKGDMPRVLSKKYTMSLNEKAALRKDLVSWRTRDFTPQEQESFDLSKLPGTCCLLNIVHKPKRDGTLCAVIDTVLPLKGKRFQPENPKIVYGIEEHGSRIPDNVPEWMVEEIKKSPEYKAIFHPPDDPIPPADDLEPGTEHVDDIPF